MHPDWIVFSVIALALIFDYVNGFHDAANSIATVVSTRVLKPSYAVIWAAFFNFIAFLVFPDHVAGTIGKGVVHAEGITLSVAAAGLVGAVFWDLLTWWWGLPTSSSHALVGGIAGAALAFGGPDLLISAGIIKISVFILIAPVFGLVVGAAFMTLTYWVFRRAHPHRVSGLFKKLQLVSAAAYSFGHGGNDAQKTAGVIMLILITTGRLGTSDPMPFWIIPACHVAIGLGTLSGGWRIVKTMGQKICDLQPVHGFSAESAGAICLFGATWLGIPVSTTHTITGAILGVGATRGVKSVRWEVAGRVIWAWVLTIPAAAAVAAGTYYAFHALGW
jgi:PiT family inorganic phosphate transporter